MKIPGPTRLRGGPFLADATFRSSFLFMTLIETWKYALPQHEALRLVQPASVALDETKQVDTTQIHDALMAHVETANNQPTTAEVLEA